MHICAVRRWLVLGACAGRAGMLVASESVGMHMPCVLALFGFSVDIGNETGRIRVPCYLRVRRLPRFRTCNKSMRIAVTWPVCPVRCVYWPGEYAAPAYLRAASRTMERK